MRFASVWAAFKEVLEQESSDISELEQSSFSQLVLHIKGEAHAVPVYSNDDIDIATEKVHYFHVYIYAGFLFVNM